MSIIVKLFKALVEALLPFLLNRKAKEAEDSSQVGKDQRDNFADILEENGELEN